AVACGNKHTLRLTKRRKEASIASQNLIFDALEGTGMALSSECSGRAACSLRREQLEGRWRSRWLVASCITITLLVAVAFAYATPPVRSGIPGVSAYCDWDDIDGMGTDATGTCDSQATHQVEHILAGFGFRATRGRLPGPAANQQTVPGPPIEMHGGPKTL